MRRAILVFTAIALVGAMFPAVALADPPVEHVYLSLGTSLAAGVQADELGNSNFGSDEAYTDQLFQRIKGEEAPNLTHVKLGCPGETTEQFFGGDNLFGNPSACAELYETGTQFGDAEAVIAEGSVSLITIDIGVNDITQTLTLCQGEPSCITAAIPGIASRVGDVIGALRATGYEGPIVAMNYYNPLVAAYIGFFDGIPGQQTPDPGFAVLTDALAQAFNGALGQVYAAWAIPVADVYNAFNAGDFGDDDPLNGNPDNVDAVCLLTYFCPEDPAAKPNTHANKHGYRLIAKTFFTIVKGLDV
jgi:lysophospholipase L1-like esterase